MAAVMLRLQRMIQVLITLIRNLKIKLLREIKSALVEMQRVVLE